MSPCVRMDSASSLSFSSENTCLGWNRLGSKRSISSSRTSASVVDSRSFNSALRPFPKARRVISYDLLSKFQIALCSFRANVIDQDRLAVAWGLRQTDVARNDRLEDLVAKKIPQVLRDLVSQVGSIVEHCQQNAFDFQI